MAKLKLICGDKERIVDNIEIRVTNGCIGVSLVNNGRDDLFDIGFKVSELLNQSMKIIPMEEQFHDELDTRRLPLVALPDHGLVEA